MTDSWSASDRLGIVKPGVDAHLLGVSAVAELLEECGCAVTVAADEVSRAADNPEGTGSSDVIERWIRSGRITRLGYSFA